MYLKEGSSPAQFVLLISHSVKECNAVQRDYFLLYAVNLFLSINFWKSLTIGITYKYTLIHSLMHVFYKSHKIVH
jgi:hypothetical protein